MIKPIVPQRLEDKKDIICFPHNRLVSLDIKEATICFRNLLKTVIEYFYLTVNLYSENTPYSVTNISDNIFEIKLNCIRHFNIYNVYWIRK